MTKGAKASSGNVKGNKLIKAPALNEQVLSQSTSDFAKNFKPLFEEMEVWRKESASSQTRIA